MESVYDWVTVAIFAGLVVLSIMWIVFIARIMLGLP